MILDERKVLKKIHNLAKMITLGPDYAEAGDDYHKRVMYNATQIVSICELVDLEKDDIVFDPEQRGFPMEFKPHSEVTNMFHEAEREQRYAEGVPAAKIYEK